MGPSDDDNEMNESGLIISAFENRLKAGFVKHTMQTNPAIEQNKNIKWSERPWKVLFSVCPSCCY